MVGQGEIKPGAMAVDSAEGIVGAQERVEPRRCMKIHERLKSKAVDIHIQKMASLTLNGHHYARLPTHASINSRVHVQQAGYDSQGVKTGGPQRRNPNVFVAWNVCTCIMQQDTLGQRWDRVPRKQLRIISHSSGFSIFIFFHSASNEIFLLVSLLSVSLNIRCNSIRIIKSLRNSWQLRVSVQLSFVIDFHLWTRGDVLLLFYLGSLNTAFVSAAHVYALAGKTTPSKKS